MDETTALLPKLKVTTKEQFIGPDLTIISGFELNVKLSSVLFRLKNDLKCAGYIKDNMTIYLVGDHRTRSCQILSSMGLRVNPKAD